MAGGTAALLYATSWVSLVLMTRPFSNTLEAWLLIVLLFVHNRWSTPGSTPSCMRRLLGGMGALAALGCFTRFTFVLFAAPIGAAVAVDVLLAATRRRRKSSLAAALSPLFIGLTAFAATGVTLSVCDSLLYGQLVLDWTSGARGTLVWPPLTNLVYNLDASNLAKHGSHPRWQHVVVNMPLMFGPAALLLLLWGAVSAARACYCSASSGAPSSTAGAESLDAPCQKKLAAPVSSSQPRRRGIVPAVTATIPPIVYPPRHCLHAFLEDTVGPALGCCAATNTTAPTTAPRGGSPGVGGGAALQVRCRNIILAGLAGLSTAPHQEARFLAPLLLPVAVLSGAVLSSSAFHDRPGRRWRRAAVFWVAWLAFNACMGGFFGYAHQAGVLPALADWGNALHERAEPPRGGVAVPQRPSLFLTAAWWWGAPSSRLSLGGGKHRGDIISSAFVESYMVPRSLLRLPSTRWASAPVFIAPWCWDRSPPPLSASSFSSIAPRLDFGTMRDVQERDAVAKDMVRAGLTAGGSTGVFYPDTLSSSSDGSGGTLILECERRHSARPWLHYWPHVSTENLPSLGTLAAARARVRRMQRYESNDMIRSPEMVAADEQQLLAEDAVWLYPWRAMQQLSLRGCIFWTPA